MSKHILDRREFLRTAGATAAAVVAVSGATTILAANRAWAMTLAGRPVAGRCQFDKRYS